MSESAHEAHKTTQENAEMLHSLLVGMENLGESVKQLREEVNAWGRPEEQEELDDLMKEVPTIPSSSEQPQVSNQSLAVTLETPTVINPILSGPSSGSILSTSDPTLTEMQKRFAALKIGQSAINVSRSEVQGNVQSTFMGGFYTPASVTVPYPGLDGHPRRIIPTPISTAVSQPPATVMKTPDQLRQETVELIQRLQKEQKEQEELARKIEARDVFAMCEKSGETKEKFGTMEFEDQSGGTNRSTIGNIFIPS